MHCHLHNVQLTILIILLALHTTLSTTVHCSFTAALPSEAARAARQPRPSTAMHAHGITRRALDSDSKGRVVLAEGQTVLLMDTLGFLGPGAVTSSASSAATSLDKNADRSHICALSKVCHGLYTLVYYMIVRCMSLCIA
jgi:hypothetical protein